jgi:biopolymer transport protein ExbD
MRKEIGKAFEKKATSTDDGFAAQKRAGRRAIRHLQRQYESDDVNFLNITAMMDMMTILLVFMLKSISSSTSNETLSDQLALPASATTDEIKESVTVTITTSTLLIDGEPVVTVRDGSVDALDKSDGANGLVIPQLLENLKKRAEYYRMFAAKQDKQFDNAVTIIADKRTSYRLLTEVLYTAGRAGYQMYRLLLLKKGGE